MKALRRSNTNSSASAASSSSSSSPPSSSWIHLRSLLVVASSPAPDRGSLKSPWSRRKRKRPLSGRQWSNLFSPDGKFRDGGVKFLKRVRRGGIEPSIRAEVWPFLLGVYDLDSSEAERNVLRKQKRKEYEKLRRVSWLVFSNHCDKENGLKVIGELGNAKNPRLDEDPESPASEDNAIAKPILSIEERTPQEGRTDGLLREVSFSYLCSVEEEDKSDVAHLDPLIEESESSDSESSIEEESETSQLLSLKEESLEADPKYWRTASLRQDFSEHNRTSEDFAKWQRIIHLDAIRINAEWVVHSPTQATVSEEKAVQSAESVGLKGYDHLEPCMIYHAARLVAVLEAYSVYDPEIGYCQGMSDLLSPILAVMEEDYEAFWCFVGFMKKARHNFRLDEVGIRRQLNIVSKIIKCKDSHLFRHLEKLEAEDCFFVYRMVVVLFRRELTFEQTVCLWEVIWADQAAIRAGIGKSTWGRIRLRAPPTDDLLLFAIAACVLQRRKLIIEKSSSMDEILRECNNMAGQLDVWRLLDDAHDLIVNLHDKI